MTIKKRFMASYLSAIIISLVSVLVILSIVLYVTVGKVPSLTDVYKMLTTQRSLTKEEEEAYLKIDNLLKKSPERMKINNNEELTSIIQSIEETGLEVALRKENDFPYYSEGLIEKSLKVHALDYELNNFKPVGTLDNAGRLYHYLKKDFQFLDGDRGSFIILKRESTLLEFFTKWGVWIILLIIIIATSLAIFINRRLTKTTIKPIETLQQATQLVENSKNLETSLRLLPQQNITKEVYDLQTSFKEMWLKLEAAENLRTEYETNRKDLIANISHDLKTPITSIIGYVEGLQDGVANTPEKRETYLNVIHQKALSLNQLIEELFLYSKLESDEQIFYFETLSLIDFTQSIIDSYEQEYPNVFFSFTHDNLAQASVMIDPNQMERVITNILENSIKFKDPKKEDLKITVHLTRKNKVYILTIEDNGIGISESDTLNVFERFFRSDKSRTPSVKGSGLGLSIVKEIMLKHQGQVTIYSALNKGTKVNLELPVVKE